MSGSWPIWRRHPLHQLSSCIHDHHLLYTMKRLPVSFVQLKKKRKKENNKIPKQRRVLKLLIDLSSTGVMCSCSREGQFFFLVFFCNVLFFVSLFVAVVPKLVQNFFHQKVWGSSQFSVAFKGRREATRTCSWKWWKSIKLRCLYPPPSPVFYFEFQFIAVRHRSWSAALLLLLPIIGLVLLNRKFH